GKLVQINGDEPFIYNVYKSKEDNKKRYSAIGKLVEKEIYRLLETECDLDRVPIPIHAGRNDPTSFIFMSKGALSQKYLLIIIHGAGAVRAGEWSRRLILEEGLEVGSQIPYIKRAMEYNYGIIVTNTNYNISESTGSRRPNLIRNRLLFVNSPSKRSAIIQSSSNRTVPQ
ncbi:unnamed protein product, partial [Didymodactylos carnosus]